jgi:erythrin-vacuolar iron transport family protein
VRNRYMDTPLISAAFQVVVGGLLVFATGILIGMSCAHSFPLSRNAP